ncbi:sulfite exporter TauE/SafE family protein [Bordetella holmesii]|uniref:Probable membrane transporter protein n=3 Tax=Bordetella holmesii TaxID=35814 RepID=A0A158M1Y8_9BORD|nr:sulfite exporter TauE/SafE family protein [Bordetella holmesii ATCC 51541]AIT25316.1 sulfite exporter TauE/SafE family protein [Bordetella holmesii 44057]AMD44526.1 permease [Bordetella holmesii H558]AOB36630.1 permease [Bordetella holmesii]EWM45881.1 sulfite exporter TauE/SafE family protein [Bordetella holmesii 70147]EWM48607.1 sulfite exporter TauE/SafE family protein [Bordetella holmesii 41130]EWM50011.1 sulfite exporter TauE/SafE family protein [Bordetella holmesii 35009]EXF86818.1 s
MYAKAAWRIVTLNTGAGMTFYVILAVFGVLAGVTTLLFGFGGGFVVVPLLYQGLLATHAPGTPEAASAMHIAIATSTCVMMVSAGLATRRRIHLLQWSWIWPLAGYIALGALLGASLAVLASGSLLRWAFLIYLGITIADCLLRKGFLEGAPARSLGPAATAGTGIGIGAIASFLGVGGSVMTVPLMRRRGLDMASSSAMANPLSLPVVVVGTLAYVLLAWRHAGSIGPWHAGYVDLRAFAVLTLSAYAGIRLSAPLAGRIPDRLHARIYIGLLVLVFVVMALR